MTTIGTALNLCLCLCRIFLVATVKALFVHDIEFSAASVEEGVLGISAEGGYLNIGNMEVEPVTGISAHLPVEELFTVSEYEPFVACVNLHAQTFVHQVEAKDAVNVAAFHHTLLEGGTATCKCQRAYPDWGEFDHRNLTGMSCGIVRIDVSCSDAVVYGCVGKDDSLARTSVEHEPQLLSVDLYRHDDLALSELYGNGVDEVFLRQ